MFTEHSPRNLLLAGLALTAAWLPAAIVAAPQHSVPTVRVAVVEASCPAHRDGAPVRVASDGAARVQ
jgi:hypothetical protein